jgi:hypothetical protein
MRTIKDFKKEFVTSVTLKSGDKILVTEDNIEPLRQILNQTNFRWRTGQHITDLSAPYDEPGDPAFGINRAIELGTYGAWTQKLAEIETSAFDDAINYVFINY